MIFHPDTVIDKPTIEIHYIAPFKESCSCHPEKTYMGWIVEVRGKYYKAKINSEVVIGKLFNN